MRKTTLAIGVALALGATHAGNALAQQDDFEVTLDVVLDNTDDIDGVVMSVIEDQMERTEMEENFHAERELEARLRDEENFIEDGGDDADEHDDGQFDDYDDGERIETDEHDDGQFDDFDDGEQIETDAHDEELLDEGSDLEPMRDEMIDEPGTDEPAMDEPVV